MKQWLYWKYRRLVDWLASLDDLHVIPRENFELLSTSHGRYMAIKTWTDELRKDRVSGTEYGDAVSRIVCGQALANAQEQRLQITRDLIPRFDESETERLRKRVATIRKEDTCQKNSF